MYIIRTIQIFVKLLPSIFALRRDRKIWIHQEKAEINSEQFRKNARKVLNTFISLGPVYIKLGQWLSSRADILPQPYLEELAKLQDSVPPAPFDQIKPIIEKDLGPINEKFDEIDSNCISGASLGQVYRGSISGQQVAIKVKRPGIEKVVAKDLKVLKKILPLALRFVDPNLRYSAKAMLSQFIETIHEEMDYTIESKNLKEIKKDMEKNTKVIVPSVFDDFSSKSVLTMEYLPGIKVTNVQALDEKGIDREQLVIDVHKVFFTMLLKHSIFHADPHPGNISVTDDGKLILYDYGMVGRMNNETRFKLIRLYLALVEKNPPRVVNAMIDLGMLIPGYNRSVIEKGIELSIRAMHGNKPDEMEVQSLMELANQTMSKFPFMLPKNLALYMRMASIIEGIYKTHNVDFKFVKVLKNILEEENLIPRAYVEELKISFSNFSKSIDTILRIGPEMKELMDEAQIYMKKRTPMVLISGSIFASAIFIGSIFLYQSSEFLGLVGMISSGLIMAVSGLFRKY
ncbi:AarF/ABC1/UbiB kinase family protein [Marine Group I thaumarchaeote]|uniref:AarF/ABC1/UbiB kinase family protein n=1 Tax=Marine Group I thaumarchaeote TaxID=2511932 RepID=A0A7K4P3X7_9ARCH|nr:MAG: AarF/ABC1/UbiB kinase family protein [Nitrosopumilus sp. YT1]NMI82300.1 AarF/ABC1/UbiB kinase family protein [Candidatus Nitrosopumilus sp. MTA1]NWJ19976.1 AarF/ABC1/UbiB kinase family protein [Marine Group I thaumarchaeote]NWJ27887.1 AarF/ABC1/UbiB kinase family protein [Marine Group I thaumarchaeote]NWJ56417.1 AarF/ABC1/UbiB kinase family protein [Marine Group I thaumarchaeote]